MLSISWRSLLRAIAGASLIVAIICAFNPKYEPLIPVVTAIALFISSFAVSDTPLSIPTSEKTKSAREERNRERMLELVKNSWVEGVLEQSLHGEVLIELGLEEQGDAVLSRQGMELQKTGEPNRLLPVGTKIMDVFDEMGQTLLILGEPGSGKTTMLLGLARDTIARAEEDPQHPIPVVFNLASWTDAKQPIADWLVDELKTKYYTPKKIASDWIENDEMLLLLDGLDEVLPERREACARAINNFRHEHGLTPLAVCCRSEEYEVLTTRLDLKGAVSLQPLTKEQIDNHLDRMGPELAVLRTTMTDDPILYELAKTPLMLSIMTLAYRGMSVHDLQPLETIDVRRKHIFDNYVERMFKPRTHRTIPDAPDDQRLDDERFSKERTIHWLSWLANRMSQHGQTIFLIEKMQPDWLPTLTQQRIFTVCVMVIIGLLGGIPLGLLVGLLGGFPLGLFVGLLAALLTGLLIGPLFALFFAMFFGFGADIRPVETLRFPGSGARIYVIGAAALLFGILLWLSRGLPFGLFAMSLTALLFALSLQPVRMEADTTTSPNEGIRRSARNARSAALLFAPLFGLTSWLLHGPLFVGLFVGLLGGILFGLHFGGLACTQHIVLRIMLWQNGSAPLNYARFLDCAAGRIFLRKVGGGYIFVHRLLLEYFASLEPEEEGG